MSKFLCALWDCNETQLAVAWGGVLFIVAFFRELAHDCTRYDEERTIARARLVLR